MPQSAVPPKSQSPRTDRVDALERLRGADRGGMGEDGWAEVPDDLVGGHPELESAPQSPGGDGLLNGPQPETDATTGAPAPRERWSKRDRFWW